MSKQDNETKRIKTADLKKQANKKVKNSKSNNGKKKFKDKHPKAAKTIKITLIVTILLLIIGAGVLVGAFIGIFGEELKIEEKSLKTGDENSTVYDADGNLLATLNSGSKRKSIKLSEMSEYLPKAYVAIEDERFYDHSGVDIYRTGYAVFNYIKNFGKSKFGGSTITQQVIKNITEDKERTSIAGAIRKIKEISKAMQVEQYLSKDQILELYLNLIYVGGDDINGVELGSIYYFDKSAKDLAIEECAFLAGINHSPALYQPFETFSKQENPEQEKEKMNEKIKKRTKTVLMKMDELGYITKEQYDEALKKVDEGLKFKQGESAKVTTDVSYITEAAIRQIVDQVLEENVDMNRKAAEFYVCSSGFKIYTTQKSNIQSVLEEVIVKPKYYTSSTYEYENKETGKKEKRPQNSTPTMVIEDHKTGQIVAAATATGDKEERIATTKLGYFNYPTKIAKQTGSSMKPLSVIAPGLEYGKLTGATVFLDQPTSFGNWNPKNFDTYRGLLPLRFAVAHSSNIPHIKGILTLGTENAVEFCKSVGLPDFTEEGANLALGGLDRGISPADMAQAYSAIANDGEYITPTYYIKVTDKDGNIIYEPKQEKRRVLTEQNAYITKSILTQPVAAGGTATYCAIQGMDVAAKTGTSNGSVDRWLCGFTNYYTAAAWYGYEYSATVKNISGNPAGNIWDEVMTEIHKDLEKTRFEEPEGIIKKTVCKVSGKLAGPLCGENVYVELFREGIVPTETCEGHGTIVYCNESKQLATPLCPAVTETIGYIPEYEIKATWKTKGGLTEVITMTCPLHGGGALINQNNPPPAQQPAQQPTQQPTQTPQTSHTTHSFVEVVSEKSPTCIQEGKRVLRCSCGATETKTLNATGHKFSDWKVTTPATATTEGTKERTCSVCKQKDTAKIPATGNPGGNSGENPGENTGGNTTSGNENEKPPVENTETQNP